jgi:hypothetical protein
MLWGLGSIYWAVGTDLVHLQQVLERIFSR